MRRDDHSSAQLSQTRELPAALRTSLLHRMMVLRHLGGTAAAPWWPPGHPDAEAIMTGIGAALGPSDTVTLASTPLLRAPVARDTTMTMRLHPVTAAGHRSAVCASLAHEGCRTEAALTVDGRDVEAVLRATAGAARAVRAGDRARSLRMPACRRTEQHDPIAILANRMRAAGQLDDNALQAIDADARRIAGLITHGEEPQRSAIALITHASVLLKPAPLSRPSSGR